MQTLFKVNVNTGVSCRLLLGTLSLSGLPVLLIPNAIPKVLPHVNHLLSRSRGKPPAKASSMQITTSVEVALLPLFGLVFIRHFQGATFLLFCFLYFKKSFVRLLCKMHSLLIKNCGKRLWPCHPEALSRRCPAFPFPLFSLPSESVSSVTGKPSCSRPTNFFQKKCSFCFEPLLRVQSSQRLPGKGSTVPSVESSVAFFYCCWLWGSN